MGNLTYHRKSARLLNPGSKIYGWQFVYSKVTNGPMQDSRTMRPTATAGMSYLGFARNSPQQLWLNAPMAHVSFAPNKSYYLSRRPNNIVSPIIINLLCPVIHPVAQTTFHYCQRGSYPTTQIDLLLICYHLSAVTFLAIAQCPFPTEQP